MAFQDIINRIKNESVHITSINNHDVNVYYNPKSDELFQIEDLCLRKLKRYGDESKEFYNITVGRINGKQQKISFTHKKLVSVTDKLLCGGIAGQK